MEKNNCDGRGRIIKDTLFGYVAAASTSSSPAEKEAEKYFLDYFSKQDYFAENPQYTERIRYGATLSTGRRYGPWQKARDLKP